MSVDSQQLAEALIDAISGLSYEIGRRAAAGAAAREAARDVLIDYFSGKFKPLPYQIDRDGHAITCHRCGRTSYNVNDIAQRYCGHCHRFHTRYQDDGL